jgi:betaine-aldehyde dehydrogenase
MAITRSYINGTLEKREVCSTFSNVNPAIGFEIGTVQFASSIAIERAVLSAKEGFEIWSQTLPAERAKVMFRAAEILRERNDEIAKVEV